MQPGRAWRESADAGREVVELRDEPRGGALSGQIGDPKSSAIGELEVAQLGDGELPQGPDRRAREGAGQGKKARGRALERGPQRLHEDR